jgi:hypothetical protein
MLAKQPNPAAVQQPTQLKVPWKKWLTKNLADWTQEMWVADYEWRRLSMGDRKERCVARAKKKVAKEAASADYILCQRGLWARWGEPREHHRWCIYEHLPVVVGVL